MLNVRKCKKCGQKLSPKCNDTLCEHCQGEKADKDKKKSIVALSGLVAISGIALTAFKKFGRK